MQGLSQKDRSQGDTGSQRQGMKISMWVARSPRAARQEEEEWAEGVSVFLNQHSVHPHEAGHSSPLVMDTD